LSKRTGPICSVESDRFRNHRSVHDSAPEPSKLRLSAPAMPRVCSGAELFGHRSRPCSGPYSCNETGKHWCRGHLLRSFTAPLMYLCRVVTLRYCMDVTVPFDPGAAGLVLVQASPELTSNMSFPFYKPVWTSTESLYLHSLYLYSRFLYRFLYSIHHSQSSQSISIYDRGIGAKISVSISISRFLRLENLL